MGKDRNMKFKEYILVKDKLNYPKLKEIEEYTWYGDPSSIIDLYSILDELFFIRQLATERSYVMAFDHAKNLKGICMVGQGNPSTAPMSMQNLFTFLMLVGANSFLIIHNHISNLPQPSEGDKFATMSAATLAAMCEIEFIGHMIVNPYGYVIDGGTLDGAIFEDEDEDEII